LFAYFSVRTIDGVQCSGIAKGSAVLLQSIILICVF